MHSLGSLQWEDLRLAVPWQVTTPLTVALSTPNYSYGNHLHPPHLWGLRKVTSILLLFLGYCTMPVGSSHFARIFINAPSLNISQIILIWMCHLFPTGFLIHKDILLLKAMISPFPKMLSIFMKVCFSGISFDIPPFQPEKYLGFSPQSTSQHNTKGLLCGSPSHRTAELYHLVLVPVAFSCYKMPHHKTPHL